MTAQAPKWYAIQLPDIGVFCDAQKHAYMHIHGSWLEILAYPSASDVQEFEGIEIPSLYVTCNDCHREMAETPKE